MKYLFMLWFFLIYGLGYGQCAMCRAALEGDENTNTAQGINNGITYLMLIPYVLAAIIGFLVYKAVRKKAR